MVILPQNSPPTISSSMPPGVATGFSLSGIDIDGVPSDVQYIISVRWKLAVSLTTISAMKKKSIPKVIEEIVENDSSIREIEQTLADEPDVIGYAVRPLE